MNAAKYICLVAVVVCSAVTGAGSLRQSSACRMTYKFRKLTADCKDINLRDLPDSLSDEIEILVASDNRIRELHNETLAPFPALQFLYLSNNFVNHIEAGAFHGVPLLEVLDLGVNGVRVLPPDLPLPLRKLYLNGNRDLEKVSLSKAFNLQFLSLADCHLPALPDIGQLPNLSELNLTGNPIPTLSARQLAPLCRLERLHTPDGLFHGAARDTCLCHEFHYWVTKYGITLSTPFNCTDIGEVERELCLSNKSALYDIRQECLARKAPFVLTTTAIISSAGCALLVAVLIILCCLWRRSRTKKNTVRDNHVKVSTLV